MNVKSHHTLKELQKFYRTGKNSRFARRIHGVYLASKGLICPRNIEITGSARRTIQQRNRLECSCSDGLVYWFSVNWTNPFHS